MKPIIKAALGTGTRHTQPLKSIPRIKTKKPGGVRIPRDFAGPG